MNWPLAHQLGWPAPIGKSPRQLLVEPVPVDLVGQGDQRVLHIDDLIQTGAEQVVMPRYLLLFRSHPIPKYQSREAITNRPKYESQIARNRPSEPRFLAYHRASNQQKCSANHWQQTFFTVVLIRGAVHREGAGDTLTAITDQLWARSLEHYDPFLQPLASNRDDSFACTPSCNS